MVDLERREVGGCGTRVGVALDLCCVSLLD